MPTARQPRGPRLEKLGDLERLVIKVGSAVIAGKGRLRPRIIADLAHDVTILVHRGYEVVLVSSGAVAAGFRALGLAQPPSAVIERQAAASVGQYKLMTTMAKAFEKYRIPVAQVLMMEDDVEDRRRFLSARHTLQLLLARGILPVVNENDPLTDERASIGDNDHLAALVTNVVSADLLIILSSVEGVYEGGQKGAVIPEVSVGSKIDHHITSSVSEGGLGGMEAKVSAAHLASRTGVPTIIADGTHAGLLPRIVQGEEIGTLFLPRDARLSSRKRWIAIRSKSRGALRVDAGAHKAIVSRGASLLPSGVVDVDGDFQMGSRVDIEHPAGQAFAVGLVSYASDDIRRMQGRNIRAFQKILGYEYVKEIVHRDDMVLLAE